MPTLLRVRGASAVPLVRGASNASQSQGAPRKAPQDGREPRRHERHWKVERYFAWLRFFRRLVTRYEVKAENFLGFLHLACALILMRQF
ncbi:transposase [Corallococcus exiguus]|nr:transposase [Corallococcus exiguus]